MKKVSIILVGVFCLSLAFPLAGEARRYYYGGGCRGGCGDYWVPAAIIGGTILAGALIIGTMNQAASPQQPAYRPIDTREPYAAPDPDFIARYGQTPSPAQQKTGGEWVTVPAQQVGGTRVPAHRIFVPNG